MRSRNAACLFLALLLAGYLTAQTTTGTITGLITDVSGAVIPSAKIQARNIHTGVQIETVSSSTGNYVVP